MGFGFVSRNKREREKKKKMRLRRNPEAKMAFPLESLEALTVAHTVPAIFWDGRPSSSQRVAAEPPRGVRLWMRRSRSR